MNDLYYYLYFNCLFFSKNIGNIFVAIYILVIFYKKKTKILKDKKKT